MALGKPRGPPVDIRALSPTRRRPLRCDPGVERPVTVIDYPHEAGFAVGEDDLSFRQPAAFLKKALRPAVEPISGCRCHWHYVVTGGFEAELKRLVPTQVGAATTSDEIGRRLDT